MKKAAGALPQAGVIHCCLLTCRPAALGLQAVPLQPRAGRAARTLLLGVRRAVEQRPGGTPLVTSSVGLFPSLTGTEFSPFGMSPR